MSRPLWEYFLKMYRVFIKYYVFFPGIFKILLEWVDLLYAGDRLYSISNCGYALVYAVIGDYNFNDFNNQKDKFWNFRILDHSTISSPQPARLFFWSAGHNGLKGRKVPLPSPYRGTCLFEKLMWSLWRNKHFWTYTVGWLLGYGPWKVDQYLAEMSVCRT